MNEPFVIGIVGKPASGKDTLVSFLTEEIQNQSSHLSVNVSKFSDMLCDILRKRGEECIVANLQRLAIELEKKEGGGAVARRMKERIHSRSDSIDVVIINGVRWPDDEKLVRSFAKNLMIAVTTDQKMRFRRKTARRERIDDATVTFEQFSREDIAKTESFIDDIARRADVVLNNNGVLNDFRKNTSALVKTHLLK